MKNQQTKYMGKFYKNMNNKNSRQQTDFDKKLSELLSRYEVPKGLSKNEAFDKLMHKIDSDKKPLNSFRFTAKHFAWSAAAALLILFIGFELFFQSRKNLTVTATNGNHTQYTLPDGSHVDMNAGSEIRFNGSNFTDDRILTLKGEAYFEIQKGRRFLISTTGGTVTILGTSLNVCAQKNVFKVSCLTGKVLVKSENSEQIITPGETVEKKNHRLEVYKEKDIQTEVLWREGIFNFENAPLSSIFEEIERQYNVKISTHEIENRYFTGKFNNRDLKSTLDIVCIPMNLDYEIKNDKTITIYNKKE
jgi:ferric-dicitrate binding protein FerR (iron transport regulator)